MEVSKLKMGKKIHKQDNNMILTTNNDMILMQSCYVR